MIKKIISQFRKYTPKVALKNIIYHFITRERKKSFGPENPNRTIYVIRPLAEKSPYYIGPIHNLLANYFYVLSHLQYAREKGWIPVVDMLNYPVYNSQNTPINGSKNAWEYFWEQPGGISLDEAYRSKNVVLSKQSWFWEWDMGYDVEKYRDKDTIAFYTELAAMTKLNEATRTYVENAVNQFMPKDEKVLGVNVRIGSHSLKSQERGEGHPIHPELIELVDVVDQNMKKWGISRVFIASDTELASDYFKAAFGDKLIMYPRLRAALGTEYAPDPQKILYAPGRSYQTALDYLTEMGILTACTSLVGSITSGFRYVVVCNAGAFDYIEVIDKGKFADGRKKKA